MAKGTTVGGLSARYCLSVWESMLADMSTVDCFCCMMSVGYS